MGFFSTLFGGTVTDDPPNSVRVDCDNCGGSGNYECPACINDKDPYCIDCDGEGWVDCPDCGGEGWVWVDEDGDYDEQDVRYDPPSYY